MAAGCPAPGPVTMPGTRPSAGRASRQPPPPRTGLLRLVGRDPIRRERTGGRAASRRSRAAKLEDPRVLQEEVPLLGEEEIEPREVDLLVVRLHLREVRVDGGVQDHARLHLPFRVQAQVALPARVQPAGRPGILREAGQAVRLHLEVPPRARKADQPLEAAGLAHPAEAPARARPRRPERLLVLAADHPPDVEAPALRSRVGRIPQGAERDRELRGPAFGPALRAHRPHRAPIGVEGAGLVGDERVELRPVRVGGEDHGVAAVAEGVEEDGHRVVARELVAVVVAAGLQDLVALPHPRHDARRLRIPGQHRDVEVAVVVQHPHLRGLGGRRSLLGLALAQPRERRRLRPGGLVETAVDAEHGVGASRTPAGRLGGGAAAANRKRRAFTSAAGAAGPPRRHPAQRPDTRGRDVAELRPAVSNTVSGPRRGGRSRAGRAVSRVRTPRSIVTGNAVQKRA